MCRMGASQIVNSDVSEARRGASCFPASPERHFRHCEHTVITDDLTALLTLQDLPHRLRGDDHPWFAALAVPNIDEDALRAKLTHVRPRERLDLALAHARVNRPEDEIRQPFDLLTSNGDELDQLLKRQKPLPSNCAS